jgi:hypothetical protein
MSDNFETPFHLSKLQYSRASFPHPVLVSIARSTEENVTLLIINADAILAASSSEKENLRPFPNLWPGIRSDWRKGLR